MGWYVSVSRIATLSFEAESTLALPLTDPDTVYGEILPSTDEKLFLELVYVDKFNFAFPSLS